MLSGRPVACEFLNFVMQSTFAGSASHSSPSQFMHTHTHPRIHRACGPRRISYKKKAHTHTHQASKWFIFNTIVCRIKTEVCVCACIYVWIVNRGGQRVCDSSEFYMRCFLSGLPRGTKRKNHSYYMCMSLDNGCWLALSLQGAVYFIRSSKEPTTTLVW